MTDAPMNSYRPVTIASGVRTSAERTPQKIALREGARELTYARLVERIDRAANGARHDLGLERGDNVMLLAPNCLEYVEIVAGFAEAGIAVATINPRQTAHEIAAIAEDCAARIVIAHPAVEELVRDAGLAAPERTIILGDEYEDWLSKARPEAQHSTTDERDAFAISYTSGTTGKAKGIVLSHRSRVITFLAMCSEYGCYGPDDSYLCVAPLFHGGGFAFAMGSVFLGGFCEILPAFDPEYIMRQLHEGPYTGTFMVPTHYHAILALEASVLERYRRHHLTSLVSNAAALPQATKELIVAQFGDGVLHETYGSTEAGIVTNLRPPDQLRKIQCVGLPFVCTRLRLLDGDGRDVPEGEVGELYSNSPYLFNGYWGKPEETAAVVRDGWVTAGDMARRDEEGYLFLVDRKKDMIISGGVNIYPREIEEVLIRHAGIADVAVVGAEDSYWGERVKAFVVAEGEGAPTAEEIIAFAKEYLAPHKAPKDIAFIDAVPRNPAGKILKRTLRDQ
ncbi:MAG: AMP-binding protein [Alphaproteobacteria bacterium]|jgi:long-chain acyl-CoA synthetase|nr:AMP-binding protein [Alphaproteobacteria bacterium]MDP6588393.1 AMP-binding protein [Alphaproteobacteria bacterium]